VCHEAAPGINGHWRQSTKATGRTVQQDERGLEPSEPDTEDEPASGYASDWPHLSNLDLDVCLEPTSLLGQPPPIEDDVSS
jgi:hypothetical protein